MAGSIREDYFLLLALKFSEPLYWKLPQFATQTFTKPLGWCGICKDDAGGGKQENRVKRKSWCWVSAGPEAQRGCKGGTGASRSHMGARSGWSSQEGKTRAENYRNRVGKKN